MDMEIIKRVKPYLYVSVGSTDFDDLVHAVDVLVPVLAFDGIMQIGHGKYEPVNLPYFRFSNSLETYYNNASVAVAHGGLATTMEILRKGIPLVSVSNSDRYDDHQEDLLAVMEKEGYLIWCRSLDNLKQDIEAALSAALRSYRQPPCEIHNVIGNFLR